MLGNAQAAQNGEWVVSGQGRRYEEHGPRATSKVKQPNKPFRQKETNTARLTSASEVLIVERSVTLNAFSIQRG